MGRLISHKMILLHVFHWPKGSPIQYINSTRSQRKKATIHQLTVMLSTSKNVLFPGHNHLLTTSTGDLTLWLLPEHQRVILSLIVILSPISCPLGHMLPEAANCVCSWNHMAKHIKRLSMVRYTTNTANEIWSQWELNTVLTSASQL